MYYLIRRKKKSDECFDERGDGYKGSGRWFLIYKVVSMTFCDLWGRTNYWGSTKKGQSSFKFAAARSWNLINFSDRNAGHLLCCVRRDREKAVNVSQVQFDKSKQPSGPFSNIYTCGTFCSVWIIKWTSTLLALQENMISIFVKCFYANLVPAAV